MNKYLLEINENNPFYLYSNFQFSFVLFIHQVYLQIILITMYGVMMIKKTSLSC